MSRDLWYAGLSKKELYEKWIFFEGRAKESAKEAERYRKLLSEAHALIGRITHQLSKRWDSTPLTEFMSGLLEKKDG